MKNSTGIVMQLNKKNAFIMTNTGEFLKVKVTNQMPNVGEVYTGEVVKNMPIYKYAAAAASLALVLLFGSAAYAYNTPVASMVIDINPSIKLEVNRWDRIIKSIPLNSDGEKVLESLSIKNKQLNDGLNLIIDEAKKDNYINSNYIESGKVITLSIEKNKLNKQFNLSKFEDYVKQNKLVIEVNDEKTDNKNSTDKNRSKSANDNKKSGGSDKKSDIIKDNGSSDSVSDDNDKNNNSGSGNTFSNNRNSDKSENNGSNTKGNSNVSKDKKDKPYDNKDNKDNNGHNEQNDKDKGKDGK